MTTYYNLSHWMFFHSQYQYTIPTKKITAFYPANLQNIWYDEIHDYLMEFEDTRNATETRLVRIRRMIKTLTHLSQGRVKFDSRLTCGAQP